MKRKLSFIVFLFVLVSICSAGNNQSGSGSSMVPPPYPTIMNVDYTTTTTKTETKNDPNSSGKAEEEKFKKEQEEKEQAEAEAKKAEEQRLAEEKAAQEIAAAKAEAEQAEAEAEGIRKTYAKYVAQADAEKEKFFEDNNIKEEDRILYKEITDKIDARSKVEAYKLEKACEKMTEAYKKLGEVYEKYGYAGDPVNIATGAYLAEYTDFTAQDYLDKFTVKRNYSRYIGCESFGLGWTCSLDSRIILCNYPPCDEKIAAVSQIIQNSYEIDTYIARYMENQNSRHPMADINTVKADAEQLRRELAGISQELSLLSAEQHRIAERNKYVTYGRFDSIDSHYGTDHLLIYVDENGNNHYFATSGNGIWNRSGELGKDVAIYNRADGGYIIRYLDGRAKEFSPYGILETETDSNGNVTRYWNDNGRINRIQLKTGEELFVIRNASGFITEIKGNTSGSAKYTYSNNILMSVSDNNDVVTEYNYDNLAFLSKITKADGSYINLKNELNYNMGYVCSSVSYKDGKEETFSWEHGKKTLTHVTVDGKEETYIFDNQRQPVYVKDYADNVTEFTTNSNGLITSVRENGITRTFKYDDYSRPVLVEYQNGGSSSFMYNNRGLITEIKDPDGFKLNADYDEKGNITSVYYSGNHLLSYVYYPNGLVKEKIENGLTSYFVYNNAGSITNLQKVYADGKTTNQTFEYDSKNRLIRYTDEEGFVTVLNYENRKITEVFNNRKQTEFFYDSKNREYKSVVTDLKTGKVHTREYFYDLSGNVAKILLDNELYEEYEYKASGEIKKHEKWNLIQNNSALEKQGIHTAYEYGKHAALTDAYRFVIDYEPESYVRYVSPSRIYGITSGRETLFDGDSSDNERVTYSVGGRVLYRVDRNYNKYSYNYKSDGGVLVKYETRAGLSSEYEFNYKGLMVKQKDFFGREVRYFYNYAGKLIKEEGSDYEKIWEYDCFQRPVSFEIKENSKSVYSKQYEYDEKNYILKVFQNNQCCEIQTLDAWNRPVEIVNRDGKRYLTYDVLNHIVSMSDENGNITKLEYDALGNAGYILNADGSEIFLTHNLQGKVVKKTSRNKTVYEKITDSEHNKIVQSNSLGLQNEITYDDNGYSLFEDSLFTGKNSYSWSDDYKKLTLTNNTGSKHQYVYDDNGKLIREINPSGKTSEYFYDLHGRLTEYKFDGNTKRKHQYDSHNNTETILYSTGEEGTVKRNSLGLITNLKTKDNEYLYEYDLSGNLTTVQDSRAGIKMNYTYDSYGRCIQKLTEGFGVSYSYDNCGRISKIEDLNTNNYVMISYDSCNREVERFYSTGMRTSFFYNQWGCLEGIVTKDNYNRLISADFILFDDKGRITLEANHEGLWKRYSYDENGRLIKCVYPFTDELFEQYKNEARSCGLSVKEGEKSGEYISLSTEEIQSLEELLQRTQAQANVSLARSMTAWSETFEYSETGSVSVSHNNIGTIYYDYDKENRLIARYGTTSKEDGMKFIWNDEGQLLSINSRLMKVDFTYGGQNRPVLISETDFEQNTKRTLAYSYDVLGRRIAETNKTQDGESKLNYFYDGFTLNVFQISPVMQNDTALTGYFAETADYSGENIRWLNENDYTAFNSFRYVDDSMYQEYGGEIRSEDDIQIQSVAANRDERATGVISLNGLPLFKSFYDSSSGSAYANEFFITDSKNLCVKVIDGSFNTLGENFYDVWGNVSGKGKEKNYSCSQTLSDTNTLIYNLGYRDYIPALKCFTTIDPVRDGSNWYAYCNCDPLNYQDCNGLTIGRTDCHDLMTNYNESILIGNSPIEKLKENGCYITTFVNMENTLEEKYGAEVNDTHNTVIKINDDKELFSTEEKTKGCLIDKKTPMDKIFPNNKSDYFTKHFSTSPYMNAVLTKLSVSPQVYLVAAVFDLTDSGDKADNHMVALNDIFNEDGKLDSIDDITASSENDFKRLLEKLDVYNLDNLKEIRFVDTGKTRCSN